MSKKEELQNELEQYELSEKTLSLLNELINVDDYKRRTKARKDLMKKGSGILPVMHKLINSDHKIIRKEAMKMIELIPDESSTNYAIAMLEDEESEIRWIAAEALIEIGRSTIRPLLKTLQSDAGSLNLRQGAHHVLYKLLVDEDSDEFKELVHMIKPGEEPVEVLPSHILSVLKKNLV